jgi:hypothetical protein
VLPLTRCRQPPNRRGLHLRDPRLRRREPFGG